MHLQIKSCPYQRKEHPLCPREIPGVFSPKTEAALTEQVCPTRLAGGREASNITASPFHRELAKPGTNTENFIFEISGLSDKLGGYPC